MGLGIYPFLKLSAIIVVSATENFNVSPFAQVWDPWSKTSGEWFVSQDIRNIARFDWYLEPEANGQALASEERHFAGPLVDINIPKDHLPSHQGSLASSALTQHTAHVHHEAALPLTDCPSPRSKDILNEGNDISSHKKMFIQSLPSGITNKEIGHMESTLFEEFINPMTELASLSRNDDYFNIEELDAYLDYKRESAPSPAESSGELAANEENSHASGCLPSELQNSLAELAANLLSSPETHREASLITQNSLSDDHLLDIDHLSSHHWCDASTPPPEPLQSGGAAFNLEVNTDLQNHRFSPEEGAMESDRIGSEVNPVTEVCNSKGTKRKILENLQNTSPTQPRHERKDRFDNQTDENLLSEHPPFDPDLEMRYIGIPKSGHVRSPGKPDQSQIVSPAK
ncbi:hypothetical protein PCASD_14191 [Puccinia coronata f. sp. avenae]|uniref:Uncharacterized protein n=1 Tax=Puccinia coronata f. sp. avenae TaxID=200324 RepID=A0A2N5U3I0_9BASI|nr:hypothetical protein PCASD_14191 [Puccinia coronata f. sp. avenae]